MARGLSALLFADRGITFGYGNGNHVRSPLAVKTGYCLVIFFIQPAAVN
jgi:hypothetical protein